MITNRTIPISRGWERIIAAVFDRTKSAKIFHSNNNFRGAPIAPHITITDYKTFPFARLQVNSRDWATITIHKGKWYELYMEDKEWVSHCDCCYCLYSSHCNNS